MMILESVATKTMPPAVAQKRPTIWGLDPLQLHDHLWAARGVFVVRSGEDRDIPGDAELYLLTEPRTLAIFRLAPLIDTLSWVRPTVMIVRLVSHNDRGYRETIVTDEDGGFARFRRSYGERVPRLARVALTCNPRLALAWQRSDNVRAAWKLLRRHIDLDRRETAVTSGRAYDRSSDEEVSEFIKELVRYWKQPSATVTGIKRVSTGVWAPQAAKLSADIQFIGPVWIGAGRSIEAGMTVPGPAVLWDDPQCRPHPIGVRWNELEPSEVLAAARARTSKSKVEARRMAGKRLFDIFFALAVLLVTLPLFPLVMLAIWLEDGRPFFFAHRRQTLQGREFGCLKFRSMRKDADAIKSKLAAENQADGPQFYIAHDPRLTRVGRFIRRTNIDEIPQFINVLRGDMAVVGPRPSPRSENQYNPAWRDSRLSVRAGITGLWQVSRTRRPGLDFQEWIKYDMEYVQNASWRLDLSIIIRTVRILLKG